MSIFDEVQAIILEIKNIPQESVKLESKLVEDLEADSLDVVEMLMSIEEKFSIQIPEDAAEQIKSVQDLVDYIEQHQ
jgi:acyl carrier protein